MMTSPLAIAVFAALLCAVATPVARALATRFGFVDRPTQRKAHRSPTPLLGGVAVACATLVAGLSSGSVRQSPELVQILVAATLLGLCGLRDDRRPLPAVAKLAAQLTVSIALVAGGAGGLRFGGSNAGIGSFVLATLWLVGICNAFNLLDNMDGLAASVAAIVAAGLCLFALGAGKPAVAMLAAALAGACIGFLPYNVGPATIFLGDAGSLFLGFALAALGVATIADSPIASTPTVALLLLFAIPIFDTSLVTIARLRRGSNPLTTPGRDHLSHRLASVRGRGGAVVRIAAVTVLAAAGALWVARSSGISVVAPAIGVSLLACGALWKLELGRPAGSTVPREEPRSG